MAELSFEDLLADEEKEAEEKGLTFTAKGGAKVLLRPVLMLPKKDQLLVLTISQSMQEEDMPVESKLDAVDRILVTAADKKDPMKKSLADLSTQSKVKIFEAWMKAADLPEA